MFFPCFSEMTGLIRIVISDMQNNFKALYAHCRIEDRKFSRFGCYTILTCSCVLLSMFVVGMCIFFSPLYTYGLL